MFHAPQWLSLMLPSLMITSMTLQIDSVLVLFVSTKSRATKPINGWSSPIAPSMIILWDLMMPWSTLRTLREILCWLLKGIDLLSKLNLHSKEVKVSATLPILDAYFSEEDHEEIKKYEWMSVIEMLNQVNYQLSNYIIYHIRLSTVVCAHFLGLKLPFLVDWGSVGYGS